ncbi:MAG: Outer membrane protein OprM precursor [Candidatus Hydrogenedentes bacterium ADurb.Bin179]|nr:MAG: Outer membrane protein OprM precursor [Candidatus Hydrogenedentes bacterium ADurb.Bin179]
MNNNSTVPRETAATFGHIAVVRLCLKTSVLLLAACCIVSCKTGPDYERPSLELPDGYKSATETESGQPELTLDWWRLFNDSDLDALCEEALEANYDLQAAMARLTQARASAASVKSGFYPVISVNPAATRSGSPMQTVSTESSGLEKVSSTLGQVSSVLGAVNALAQGETPNLGGVQAGATLGTASSTTGNRFQVPFDLSYEIDLWGRVQRSYESAKAQVQASVYELEVVRQTLLADVARNYFNLRMLDTHLDILNRNLALYGEQAELTRKQYEAGLVNETNALQAEIQLEATRAQTTDIQRQRADLEHAIAILLGKAPAAFSLDARTLDTDPPVLPAGLPADLLRRRPDLAVAEQNLAAACAEIGVAEANFFPSIKLVGSAGFQSAALEDILDWKSKTWSFGPSISMPIFQGGQLKASLEKAWARYDELQAAYRNSVLGAFRDVEDSLTDIHGRSDEAEAREKAVAAAREYLRLVQIQYDTGTIDYLDVINAEQTLLNNELSEVQALNERRIATVLLIKALGGGWDCQIASDPAAQVR